MLQISGNVRYAWDAAQPRGARIDAQSITIDGVQVAPAKTYRITTNAFLADGGDSFVVLREGTNRATGMIDVDAFQKYLKAHSPLAPPPMERITRRN